MAQMNYAPTIWIGYNSNLECKLAPKTCLAVSHLKKGQTRYEGIIKNIYI